MSLNKFMNLKKSMKMINFMNLKKSMKMINFMNLKILHITKENHEIENFIN